MSSLDTFTDQPEPAAGARAEEALIRLSTEIAGYRTLSDLLAHLSSHLEPLFPGDAAGVVLYDLETEEGEIALSFGADLAGLPQRVHADRGPAGWVWRDQTPRADVLSATE